MEVDEYAIQPVREAQLAIFETSIDLNVDIAEAIIDSLLDDGILKEIPIIGTVFKLGKTCKSIERMFYVKKILVFAQALQAEDVDVRILEERYEYYKNNEKQLTKDLEIIIEYLNRQVGIGKSKLFAKAYFALLSQKIDYEDYSIFMESIDQVFLTDLETLKEIYEKSICEGEEYNYLACSRLSGCGLIEYYNGLLVEDSEDKINAYARITDLGKEFCRLLL